MQNSVKCFAPVRADDVSAFRFFSEFQMSCPMCRRAVCLVLVASCCVLAACSLSMKHPLGLAGECQGGIS